MTFNTWHMTRCAHIYMSCACKCSCTSTYECATVSHFLLGLLEPMPVMTDTIWSMIVQETPPGSVALATLSNCTHTHTVTPFHVSRSEKKRRPPCTNCGTPPRTPPQEWKVIDGCWQSTTFEGYGCQTTTGQSVPRQRHTGLQQLGSSPEKRSAPTPGLAPEILS